MSLSFMSCVFSLCPLPFPTSRPFFLSSPECKDVVHSSGASTRQMAASRVVVDTFLVEGQEGRVREQDGGMGVVSRQRRNDGL